MANLANEFFRADWLWRKIPEVNKIGLSVPPLPFRYAPNLLFGWALAFLVHTRINSKWIPILVSHYWFDGFLFLPFAVNREKVFTVCITASSCNFMVTLCVVCLEAWLRYSHVKPHQN